MTAKSKLATEPGGCDAKDGRENRRDAIRFGAIRRELLAHAPFTAFGTLTGIALMAVVIVLRVPVSINEYAFWTLHPIHVFLSALVTTAMYRLHGGTGIWRTLAIGYVGSVGIATLSDSGIPYLGELLLGMDDAQFRFGAMEAWWIVNPLSLAGIAIGAVRPHTKFPHAGHILISTWASLFHMLIAAGLDIGIGTTAAIAVFLFLAVWVPCCTSDIVFPLLFTRSRPAAPVRATGALPESRAL